MKTFFVLAACAAGLCGADIVVDDGETVDLSVAGDAVQTEPVWFAAEAGRVEKSGAGAWTLAVSNLATSASAVVAVREGALNLVGGAPGDVPVPSNVLGRAALWFDAAKADTRVEGTSALNTGVATWYDARETREADGSWGARHFCATARTSWLTNEVAEGVWEKAVLHPVARTFADAPALSYVHFNGRQSGSWMGFCEPGTRAARTANIGEIRHLFYSGYVEGSWGFPVGVMRGTPPFWHPQSPEGALGGAWSSANSAHPGLFQGRSLLNGAVFDEAATAAKAGPYVYEWDAGDIAGHLGNFFNDRDMWGPTYFRSGGDALGEVIAFTNRLTALEREQVANYLLRKWSPAVPTPTVEVRTARGAEVTVADDAAQTVTGAGTLRLAEAGRAQAYSMTEPFAGSTRVEASATLVAGEPQLALHAGDAYTVTRDLYDGLGFANAPDAAKAAAGEAHLDLAADVAVRVASLPETIKTLAVSGAGELVLAAPPPVGKGVAAVAGDVYATMPNADMEEWTGTGAVGFGTLGATTYHWTVVSRENSNLYFLNLPSLRENGHWMIDGGTKNFRWADYPFQGNVVMALKQGCVVENTVTFPADGDYELTFLTGGRMDGGGYPYAGGWVKVSLVDGAGAETPVGTAFGYVGVSTRRQRFLVRGVKAGAYTFRLDHAVGTGDAHTILDDFRFRLVTDVSAEEVVYPPNADFEQVDMAWDGRYARDAGHTAADWTFAQSEETGTEPDVCLVTRGMRNMGYRAGSTRGGVQLVFYGNAGSATSAAFTLPAGTWKLRLRKAAFHNTEGWDYRWNGLQVNRANGLAGELLEGDDTVLSLGTLGTVFGAKMARATLPTAVTLTAPRTVRLRLRGTVASTETVAPCAVVDELEFVRQDAGGELVANGTFANTSAWTLRSNRDTSTTVFSNNTEKSTAHIWDPCRLVTVGNGEMQQAYGNTYGVGTLALDICQCGSAEQAIAFPAAGMYRLAFSARSRLWIYENAPPNRNWGGNQGQFYLVDAQGVTNEIFRTPSLYASNFVFRSTLFNVPAAGTYMFGIRGLNGMPQPDGTTLQVGRTPNDVEFFVDQVSVKPAGDAVLDLDEGLALDLRDSAKLRLDFTGTNEIDRLRLGGVSVSGYVDATHPSGLVCGTGCLYVRPKGTVLLLR